MEAKSQQAKGRDSVISLLNAAIDALNLAKEVSSFTPAKAVFGSASVLLTMIKDSMANELEHVDLGLVCADICKALDRGLDGKNLDRLSQSVCDAIGQLTTTVAEIQGKVIKRSGRGSVSRLFHAKSDKDAIAAWKLDLNRILHVFNTELAINTHVIVSDVHHGVADTRAMVSDMHRNMLNSQQGADDQYQSTQASTPGELPPPPPRAFFGRDELIDKIVGLAENLTPIALIGAGGIGKTAIALTVLHNDRVKQRFGDNRRFIRCDQFPASCNHFLSRLSKVIGAGVENPQDLAPLRPFLSSKEMFIILDNAESILDPQETDARKIYAMVEELCQFRTICLCITSRITTVPRQCKRPGIPTLSMEAACDIFYGIYDNSGRSEIINNLLMQLDFHALSVTLLATTASHNMWDHDRLAREWDKNRTKVLRTAHNESLAAAIELSLDSPTFQELGPDARELLEVIAFFPQGVDENKIEWLFPTISDGANIFNKFCILSLTYRSNGFVTMLAPLRDYLCPQNTMSAPLLCMAKEHYFSRLSVVVVPGEPGFEEAKWITSEDVNVEHLLNVFTSIDTGSSDIWHICACFMRHLYWHKQWLITLGPKIEELPDDHPSKPECLYEFSCLFSLVGNYIEHKRLLTQTLKLQRDQGNKTQVAQTLRTLSGVNRHLQNYTEGLKQVQEALEIYKQLSDSMGQARSLCKLARLLQHDNQPNAAQEAVSLAINLLDKDEKFDICKCYRVLGKISQSKGEIAKAIDHFEEALVIASSFNWHDLLFRICYSLAGLFYDQGRFDDAHLHIECAKLHTANDRYHLGQAMELKAECWYKQHRFEEAKSEVLCAVSIYEKFGATKDMEDCRKLLQKIKRGMDNGH